MIGVNGSQTVTPTGGNLIDILVGIVLYRITSNLSHVSNYSDSVMNYFFTSNSIVHVNNLEYFLL